MAAHPSSFGVALQTRESLAINVATLLAFGATSCRAAQVAASTLPRA
jgi:hypothetical protein